MSQHTIHPHFRTSPVPTDCHREIVDRDTFVSLLTGRRPLVRCDDSDAGLRGLLDRENHRWYVIQQSLIEN